MIENSDELRSALSWSPVGSDDGVGLRVSIWPVVKMASSLCSLMSSNTTNISNNNENLNNSNNSINTNIGDGDKDSSPMQIYKRIVQNLYTCLALGTQSLSSWPLLSNMHVYTDANSHTHTDVCADAYSNDKSAFPQSYIRIVENYGHEDSHIDLYMPMCFMQEFGIPFMHSETNSKSSNNIDVYQYCDINMISNDKNYKSKDFEFAHIILNSPFLSIDDE